VSAPGSGTPAPDRTPAPGRLSHCREDRLPPPATPTGRGRHDSRRRLRARRPSSWRTLRGCGSSRRSARPAWSPTARWPFPCSPGRC